MVNLAFASPGVCSWIQGRAGRGGEDTPSRTRARAPWAEPGWAWRGIVSYTTSYDSASPPSLPLRPWYRRGARRSTVGTDSCTSGGSVRPLPGQEARLRVVGVGRAAGFDQNC